MRKLIILLLVFIAAYSAIPVQLVLSQHPAFDNNPFFMRNDPLKYWENKNPHGGAGYGRGMELTPQKEFKSNFLFLHRGVWNPKCGIGEHAHRRMEEMYVNLTSYAHSQSTEEQPKYHQSAWLCALWEVRTASTTLLMSRYSF